MQGIGVDIEAMDRFHRIAYLDRFLSFVFTSAEIEASHHHPDRMSYIASRFAVKEAVIKALPEKATYLDFEIVKEGSKPVVRFQAQKLEKYKVHVSLSHAQNFVTGFAVVE